MNKTSLAVIGKEQMQTQSAVVRTALALPPDVPDQVVEATVLLALRYGLDPSNREIQVIPTGYKDRKQVYSPYIGAAGLARSARRQSAFSYQMFVMEPDEVKEIRKKDYEPEDVGVRCVLYRLDIAKQFADAGVPYNPIIGVGLWRVKATYKKAWQNQPAKWIPDSIPNTKSALWKAEQRALRDAIMKAYDLDIPTQFLEPEDTPEDAPVDSQVLQVDEDTLLLLEHHDLSDVTQMSDDQREAAAKYHRYLKQQRQERDKKTPEERQTEAKKAANELGMGANKPKRLGEPIAESEPEVVEAEFSEVEEKPESEAGKYKDW